jgi:hypothetical protein
MIPTQLERQTLQQIVADVPEDVRCGHANDAVALAESLGIAASRDLGRLALAIRALMDHSSTAGVVEIDFRECLAKCPPVPKTPLSFVPREQHALVPLDIIRCAIIGAAGGYSFGYADQGGGNLCDDVMPIRQHHELSGASTGIEVGWHTEDAPFNRGRDNADHPVYDLLSLAYLRNPGNDKTRISMPSLHELGRGTLDELRKHQFMLLTSHAQAGESNAVGAPTSFVYGDKDWIRFTFARLPEQREQYRRTGNLMDVIDALLAHLKQHAGAISSIPGQVAFIDNMRVAHARAPLRVAPGFNGSDRWQRRLGAVSSQRRPFVERFMDEPRQRLVNNKRLVSYLRAVQ